MGLLGDYQSKHKVFLSYHHENDQAYKEFLLLLNTRHNLFIDASVSIGDIDDCLADEAIRVKIRDEYLADSTVTILLVGTETKNRKHIDWELYSSMFNGSVNKQSGVLVINLPSTNCTYYTAAHGLEEKKFYPETTNWTTITSRAEYESRYPYMPSRIIDNLLESDAKISVTNWDDISANPGKLQFLINATFNDRASCEYNLSQPLRRANF